MALEIVTGLATDFGLNSLTGLRLVFTPSGPGIQGSFSQRLLDTQPITVYPSSVNGYFTLQLMSTDDVTPEMWYTVRAEWLDAAGSFTRIDYLPWKLYVPTGGGNIGQLLNAPPNGLTVWVDETNNLLYRFWYRPSTGILWSNS